MVGLFPVLALFFWMASSSIQAESISKDDRFGFVGTGGKAFAAKYKLGSYTLEGNYNSSTGSIFSSVNPAMDPDSGYSVVREVAKLNVRIDALGETNAQFQEKLRQYTLDLATWYSIPPGSRPAKPAFPWYHPNANAIIQAESLQIVTTIKREKARNPQVTGTIWEIGNEPNFFPAITPEEYAAIFEAYSRVIKKEDPEAEVAMGSLFLPEFSSDLKLKISEDLESRIRVELQKEGVYDGFVSAGFFAPLVKDVQDALFSQMLTLSSREYVRKVLDATTSRPDIITVHIYPYDDRAPSLDSAAYKFILDTTLAGLATVMSAKGFSVPIWVTEYGNIQPLLSETGVAQQTALFTHLFENNSSIKKWFYYKATGLDTQLPFITSGPIPLTRLAIDSAFSPLDGNFPCGKLNANGKEYYRLSHGGENCFEHIRFSKNGSSHLESDSILKIKVELDIPSDHIISVNIFPKAGSAIGTDYSLPTNSVTFGIGETTKEFDVQLLNDSIKAETETVTLVLRDPLDAGLSLDSTYLLTIVNDDNGPPVINKSQLKPAVLNLPGSVLSKTQPLLWDWVNGFSDPDFQEDSSYARIELRLDSSSVTPLLTLDSIKLKSVLIQPPSTTSSVWVRLKIWDVHGKESPWSETVKLVWQATPIDYLSFAKVGSSDSENISSITIAVQLNSPADHILSVGINTKGGSATLSDYVFSDTTLTFAIGETSKEIEVKLLNDSIKEAIETLTLVLRNPIASSLSMDSTFILTILDDDNGPPIINSASLKKVIIAEGDSILVHVDASDPESDSLTYLWTRLKGDTLSQKSEFLFRPRYLDAGVDTFRIVVKDRKGGVAFAFLPVLISNTALKPKVLNVVGSVLTPSNTVLWGWENGLPDPDFNQDSILAVFELRLDSVILSPFLKIDSVRTKSITLMPAPKTEFAWARLKIYDRQGRETLWSESVKFIWQGAPVGNSMSSLIPENFSVQLLGSKSNGFFLKMGLPKSEIVEIEILDARGSLIGKKFQSKLSSGLHRIALPRLGGEGKAGGLSYKGMYLIRVIAGEWTKTISFAGMPL